MYNVKELISMFVPFTSMSKSCEAINGHHNHDELYFNCVFIVYFLKKAFTKKLQNVVDGGRVVKKDVLNCNRL